MPAAMLNMVPDNWGPKLFADSGCVTRTRTGPNAIRYDTPGHYAIILLTPQPRRIMAVSSDRRQVFGAAAGTLELVPASTELFAEWSCDKENFLFGLPPSKLREVAIAEYEDDRTDLALLKPGHIDRRAFALASMLGTEFSRAEEGAVNELFVDSLLTVFSTHLLRQYGRRRTRSFIRGGLPVSALRRVEDYIHGHLDERLPLLDLAAVSGYSPSHFVRAFRQSTGMAPHQYIVRLRLRRAESLLLEMKAPLAEIARRTGFGTHSHLTATMKRYWGTTPSELRRQRW